jgi:glycosyltransferase involved in cell wall biosynthesis
VVVNAHSPDFVIREQNEEPRYQLPHYWTGRLEMFCLRAADARICPSRYLSRQLEERFGGSISVDPFPLPWTEPDRGGGGEAIDPHKVLYLGRLEVRKGTLELVAACDRLWRAGKHFELHLAGSDTTYYPRDCRVGDWIRRRYRDWIEDGRLRIRGAMDHADLMGEIRSAAFTVVPSRWENWPNTCIEAMSLGKVVVGSTDGGQAEMIGEDGTCGFLYANGQEDGLDTALRRALELDPGERREMGESARRRIAGLCAPENVLPRRLEHFDALRGSRPGRIFPFTNRHLRNTEARKAWPDGNEVKGRVSVVIPYYNLGKYVGDTVDSVLAARWPDTEIIVVDDGSEDPGSMEALDNLRKRAIDGLHIHRQENRGLAAARNAGAQRATGEYLLLLDADDQIEPAFIRRCVDVLEAYDNVHIVYSWERYIEASDDIYPCWNFEFPYLLAHNMTCPVSLLYRRSYLAFGPSRQEMAYNFEDFELWISLVANGCGGVALVEPLSRYRVRRDSMWQGSARAQHLFLQDRIVSLHPGLYARYGPELFALQNANGPAQKWIKPGANSPFDEYEQWSRRRIANLEKEVRRWWEHGVGVEKRLQESEREKYAVWCEKNRIEERLREELEREGETPS